MTINEQKVVIEIELVKRLKRELDMINAIPFDDIQFYENGKPIEVSDHILNRWKFIGLNNTDFVVDGFYKLDEDE